MDSSKHSVGQIDFSALTMPMTGRDIDAFRHLKKAISTIVTQARIVFYAMIIVIAAVVLNWYILLVGLIVVELLLGLVWLSRLHHIRPLQTGVRLARFAQDNGFFFTPTVQNMNRVYLGSIYQENKADARTDFVVNGTYNGHSFWLGLFCYSVHVNKRTIYYRRPLAVISLPRAVPHVILDRGNQGSVPYLSNLIPLRLEGDFNKHFYVLCPPGYERDVLYFLTPELMQLFVEMDTRFDIEIIGDQLYFYADNQESGRPVDPAVWQQFFAVMDFIGGELIENTRRYQDERIDPKLGTLAVTGLGKQPTPYSTKTIIISVVVTFVVAFSLAVMYLLRSS